MKFKINGQIIDNFKTCDFLYFVELAEDLDVTDCTPSSITVALGSGDNLTIVEVLND